MKAEQAYQLLENVHYLHLLILEFRHEVARIENKPQDKLAKYAMITMNTVTQGSPLVSYSVSADMNDSETSVARSSSP